MGSILAEVHNVLEGGFSGIKLEICIRDGLDSNRGRNTGHSDWGILWFPSGPTKENELSIPETTVIFLPNTFQFIIH
jgi:hypothetical protein